MILGLFPKEDKIKAMDALERVGSSAKIIAGSCAKARAIEIRCC
jgi:ABC-type phosphate/phosphonate transport system ATPase subunit